MLNNGSLSGIKVIDLSRLLPGPYCSMILADHGAQVISVEDKRYKNSGHYIPSINRNKQHICLNLKKDQGREIFFSLMKDADVVIEGFRPGVVNRLGIDYEAVRQINSKIIYCSITGYGQTGPYCDRAGHDINYLAVSGLLDLMGEADHPPAIPGVQFADMAGGGMNAAIGILMAIIAREKTGQGQYIDIAMADGMVGFLPIALLLRELTGQFPKRANSYLSHRYAFYNTYETKDKKHISVGALEPLFWKKLCEKLNLTEYIPLQYDEQRREQIISDFRKAFKSSMLAHWESELSELDACCEPVLNVEEVLESALFRERKMVIKIKDDNGQDTSTLGVAVKLSQTPGTIRTPSPTFGQDTMEVLKDLGLTQEQIKNLTETNVI